VLRGRAIKLFRKKPELAPEVAERVPPGQFVTDKWPVLHYGPVPRFDPKKWDFRVFGNVEDQLRLTWDEFEKLPRETRTADMHCVTTWSKLDQVWEGVPFRFLVERARPRPDTGFVIAHCEYGFTANVPLDAVLDDRVMLATGANGKPLEPEHGYPLRLVVPKLYAWKSAKWLRGIEFSVVDRPGFWERNGYHNRGDPWLEERYSG
jgi:DMSO/TMAO reductase YedYZ molybdopterin-dependent catalytic subunit